MSYYLTFTYLYAFIVVVKPWYVVANSQMSHYAEGSIHIRTIVEVNYFMQAQTVALTLFGIIAGLGMLYLRRYKIMLVIGLVIRTLCVPS